MISFNLKVVPFRWNNFTLYDADVIDFILEEDSWNDYGYMTTYHLHFVEKVRKQVKEIHYLGQISIMKLGQEIGDSFLLSKIYKDRAFQSLPDDFVSMTFSLDVYNQLAEFLSLQERKKFVEIMHLILSTSDPYYEQVKDDECFKSSFLRYASIDSYSLVQARRLMLGMEECFNFRKEEVIIQYSNATTPIHLTFSRNDTVEDSLSPNGVVAFIGKNGSGKSTSLYKLASLLYADPKNRDRYKEKIGTISPNDLGINQLMILSYSPFDNFVLPGSEVSSDLKVWSDNLVERKGRFIYCGLRDVKKEADEALNNWSDNQALRTENIYFKDPSSLAVESFDAYAKISSDVEANDMLKELIEDAESYQNEIYDLLISGYRIGKNGKQVWIDFFNQLSTGYKFFIHAMFHVIAYLKQDAIVLFDEPENHLQSPLLVFMLAEIRKILVKRNSVLLIATHSPVILQETLSENVRIVRRNGDMVSFSKPMIETFGENLGAISAEVFDLTTDRINYFSTIDKIYDALEIDKKDNVQAAIDAIREYMGGISNPITQYVVTKYLSDSFKICGD